MSRWMSMIALCGATACSAGSTETVSEVVSPDAFVGVWRSVTPSLEFIGLSVHSKSSEIGVLGARLTFSGVYWEGSGRIEGDSLVATMWVGGAPAADARVIVAHARDARTLRVQMRAGAGAATDLDLTFVRED